MRWLTATITVALLLGAAATPSAASSFDPTKIDASFLSEVLASPTDDFDVIVRSTPADNEGKADRAAERRLEKAAKSVKKQGGSVKQALAIVGAVSARLKGVQILKLTRDDDVDYVVKDQKLHAQFDPALAGAIREPTGEQAEHERRCLADARHETDYRCRCAEMAEKRADDAARTFVDEVADRGDDAEPDDETQRTHAGRHVHIFAKG